MPRKVSELTGQVFGKLTVINRGPNNKHHRTTWNCICECGKATNVDSKSLKSGATKSCGCGAKVSNLSHGMTKSKEHYAWLSMKARCSKTNKSNSKHYSDKGITVCDEWIDDFEAFYDYVGDAPSPKHSIDRIDPTGNYEPGNVRWACSKTQRANQIRPKSHKPRKDLTGQTFGWLTVKERDMSRIGQRVYWICQCKCGKVISRDGSTINNKIHRSCGCYKSNQHTK